MRSFKRLPPQYPPPFLSFLLFVCCCCSDLTTLLVYNDSPWLANPKRMTVVKRKGRRDENGSRRDSAVDTMYILCNVTEKGQEEETMIICWKKSQF